jgi:hypothetical protein
MPAAYFRVISPDKAKCAERNVQRRFHWDVAQDPVLTKTATATRLLVTGEAVWKGLK